MQLHDLVLLLKLLAIQKVSGRELAEVAGWTSHTYMQRLLRGEVNTLKPEPAARIAHHLGVPLESLFVPRVSAINGRSDQESRRRKVS
jgi:transcriptional regulator with XRE-family HTH domain